MSCEDDDETVPISPKSGRWPMPVSRLGRGRMGSCKDVMEFRWLLGLEGSLVASASAATLLSTLSSISSSSELPPTR
jgi:hypothetical protein